MNKALSYWIQTLRACTPTVPGACYNGMNMAQMYDKWHKALDCSIGGNTAELNKLGPEYFMFVFLFVWTSTALVCLREAIHSRFFDRMLALCSGTSEPLWKCIKAKPWECVNEQDQVAGQKLKRTLKAVYLKAVCSQPLPYRCSYMDRIWTVP